MTQSLSKQKLQEALAADYDFKALAIDLIDQLEESTYLFHQMLSSMPNSMMLLSPTGRVQSVSALMAAKYLEKDSGALVGKYLEDISFPVFFNSNQDAFIKKLVLEAMNSGIEYENVLIEAKDAKGEDLYVEMSIKPLRSKDEKISAIVLSFTEQFIKLNMVPEEQEKEQFLMKMGSLSAGLIHEVKNPIQSISGIVQLLQLKLEEQSELYPYLDMIMNEINNVNILLTEFLGFSGKTKVEMSYGHINEICQDVLKLVYGSCYLNKIKLEENFGENIPNMVLDQHRMKQVIVNFMVNSIDAVVARQGADKSQDYEGRIRLTTYYDFGLNECNVVIEDNGIGMNTETIQNICKPFFTTKKYGTGIGVSISKNIITEHGGLLKVESEPGRGSRFRIILPELAGLMQIVGKEAESDDKLKSVTIKNSADLIRDGFQLLSKEENK